MRSGDFFSWLKGYWPSTNAENMPRRAQICSGSPWAVWAFLSHKDSGNSDYRAQHNKSLGFSWYGTARGRKTAFNTVCAHAAASSLLPPPPMTISVSTYPFSSAPPSPANFPISFKQFPSAFLTFSLLLFRQLAACSCLLAMSPVKPKVSLPLLSKDTSFHGKKTSSCCSSSSATTGEKFWLQYGN